MLIVGGRSINAPVALQVIVNRAIVNIGWLPRFVDYKLEFFEVEFVIFKILTIVRPNRSADPLRINSRKGDLGQNICNSDRPTQKFPTAFWSRFSISYPADSGVNN